MHQNVYVVKILIGTYWNTYVIKAHSEKEAGEKLKDKLQSQGIHITGTVYVRACIDDVTDIG